MQLLASRVILLAVASVLAVNAVEDHVTRHGEDFYSPRE